MNAVKRLINDLHYRFQRSMFEVVRFEEHDAPPKMARGTITLRVRKWHPLYVCLRTIDYALGLWRWFVRMAS